MRHPVSAMRRSASPWWCRTPSCDQSCCAASWSPSCCGKAPTMASGKCPWTPRSPMSSDSSSAMRRRSCSTRRARASTSWSSGPAHGALRLADNFTHRQAYRERGALAGAVAGGTDGAAVQLHQLLADRQPEAQSGVLTGDGGVCLAEAVEHERQEGGIDADAAVAYGDLRMGRAVLDADLDPTALRSELQRVGEQVGDHLLQPVRVATGRTERSLRHPVDGDALGVRGGLDGEDRRVHDLLQIDAADIQPRHAGGDPAHVQKVIDDPGLRTGVALDDLEAPDDLRR